MPIPFNLQQSLETGNAVLFVGAGMGYNMIDSDGNSIPDAYNLAKKNADHFSVPVTDASYDLARISQYVVSKFHGRDELMVFLKSCLLNTYPDEFMSWIPTIKWKAIFTTNYDDAIEKAYDYCKTPVQEYITITQISGFKDYNEATQVPIIHLHGSLFTESPDIIITLHDYARFNDNRKSLFEIFKHRMVTSCILYTGYSHNDSNFNYIINDLEIELYPKKINTSYRIDPVDNELNNFILQERNIKTINQTFTDFVKEARLQLNATFSLEEAYKKFEPSIPNDIKEDFHNNPAPVVRLLSSWQYVNQLSITENPDVYNYVRGDKPSWSIIFNEKFFHRSIEEEIYDMLLDYATDPKKRVRICTITGSAGYGISTLLMIIAKRLLQEHIGKIFYHNSSKELREGDVFFASSIFPEDKLIFFIDNAADYAIQIKSLITHARENKIDIIIILGDRTNELSQSKIRGTGNSFIIQPLSDGEIENLIDYLADINELNKLKYLDREFQISAIRKNYNRELLVAIREATEGINFDLIIQDEFFGIQDELAREIYALIACIHQHSAILRIELLSRLLQKSISELYEKIKSSLQGIAFYELINEEYQEYAIRTRHRIIASIVWNRCLTPSVRDNYIHMIINNLNIAYPIDKKAFECFIRSDQLVDSLISLESKMRFFEKACKLDQDNPYVLQHFARMLVRSNKEILALSTIDMAITMDSSIRTLYHTKGYILQHMAINDENIEIARRYLGQSEDSYLIAMRMNNKDSYCYQGLSSLYLAWAKKTVDDSEKTLYLAKAESIIEDGLQKSTDKEAIWIEASNIDEYIGDMPNQIKALQEAVEAAPLSTLSKYLLAKAYNIQGDYPKGKQILKDIVLDNPGDYKACIEYVKVLLKTGETLQTAIAVLNQSTLFGYSDPRFIAILGGLLFLNKNFTEADSVFNESVRREMFNTQKEMFDPEDYGVNSIFAAKVNYIGNGYSYLSIEGYKEVKCYSSKYNGYILTHGMKLTVKLTFSPKNPIANIITL
jgi:hypothetical protein